MAVALRSWILVLCGCLVGWGVGAEAPKRGGKGPERVNPPLLFAKPTEKSIFPEDLKAIHPEALRLCTLFYEVPEKQKALCCKTFASPMLTRECTRILSAALQSREVIFHADRFEACEKAFRSTIAGCDWIGPWTPPLPSVCSRLLTGAKGKDASCRSSLECQAGYHCSGVGPLNRGFCQPPRRTGAACNRAVDPLATFARQDKTEFDHPECSGFCKKYRCAPYLPLGSACSADVQCGPKAHCDGQICQAEPFAKPGQACTGRCQEGYRCWNFRCQKPLPEGSACSSDPECRSACEPSKTGSVCRPRCGFRISSGPSLTTLLERYRQSRKPASRPASRPSEARDAAPPSPGQRARIP